MRKKGKFVVIEGIDGSGKTTQFNLLKKRLTKSGYNVKTADFPRYYTSIWGKMVGDYLTGKYGNFDEISPHIAVLLYMVDQYTWSRDYGKKMVKKGKIILSNRYFTSNVHQIAKLKGKKREEFRKWLWNAGYKHLGLLKPDLVIFLDVSPEVSHKMNKNKKSRKYLNGKKSDEAEKRFFHQKEAYKQYLKTVRQFDYWKKVRCISSGKIDLSSRIHDRIWKIVSGVI